MALMWLLLLAGPLAAIGAIAVLLAEPTKKVAICSYLVVAVAVVHLASVIVLLVQDRRCYLLMRSPF